MDRQTLYSVQCSYEGYYLTISIERAGIITQEARVALQFRLPSVI